VGSYRVFGLADRDLSDAYVGIVFKGINISIKKQGGPGGRARENGSS